MIPRGSRTLAALALGAVGGALAWSAGLPAAWLVGASVLVAAACAAGLTPAVPRPLQSAAFAGIGISIGSGVDGETFARAADWLPSLTAVVVSTLAVMVMGSWFLARVARLDTMTAKLSAAPGTLAYVLGLTLEGKGDPTAVMLIQSLRLLAITACVPLALDLTADLDATAPAASAAAVLGYWEGAALLALALPLGWGLARLRLPASYLLAGIGVSAAAHFAGIVTGPLPDAVTTVVYVVTGTVIGQRFRRMPLEVLARVLPAAIGAVVLAGTVAAAFALAVVSVTQLSFGQAWIALAPGGVEAMAALALALDYDPAFVAAHHLTRIAALTIAIPLWTRA